MPPCSQFPPARVFLKTQGISKAASSSAIAAARRTSLTSNSPVARPVITSTSSPSQAKQPLSTSSSKVTGMSPSIAIIALQISLWFDSCCGVITISFHGSLSSGVTRRTNNYYNNNDNGPFQSGKHFTRIPFPSPPNFPKQRRLWSFGVPYYRPTGSPTPRSPVRRIPIPFGSNRNIWAVFCHSFHCTPGYQRCIIS